MLKIKPISDLKTYSTVLNEVAPGSPVFLTKNGHGKYVIQDISDYEHHWSERKLLQKEGAHDANLRGYTD